MKFTLKDKYLAIPVFLMAVLAMLVLPLPSWVIDTLFTFNIVLALMVLLASVSAKRPLDFSVFPTILLLATLMRLALNVASTRIVLLEGHTGPDAAGQVIQSFGEVVIGGNYVVGLVIFVILMIVNFFVVTKGGERISEVSARFTLDAMPGKQMAIDADLNAGSLSQDEAKNRRQDVAREADFYGSMDGASKFVKGDAIAGLLILLINLFGGFFIGIFQHGLSAGESFEVFALLTIGDGLVAQIPSLLLATAAAIIVTRVNDESEMQDQITKQMLSSPRVIATVGVVMLILGLIPGMPKLAFLTFAAVLIFVAWRVSITIPDQVSEDLDKNFAEELKKEPVLSWGEIPFLDKLKIELGYQLVPLAESSQKGELPNRIRGVRKKISEQIGILVPEVRIRDNLQIAPNEYRIKLDGSVIARGEANPDKLLAIQGGEVYGKIDGELVREPAYGMEAVAINLDQKAQALTLGYSVVDTPTIISTHIDKVIKEHLDEIFSHDDVLALGHRLKEISETLNESLNAALTPLQQMKVFRMLLADKVSLLDIESIATSMVNTSEVTKDPISIVSDARMAIRRSIIRQVNGDRDILYVILLGEGLEQTLIHSLQQASQSGQVQLDSFPVDPQLISNFQQAMPDAAQQAKRAGYPAVLLVHPQLRPLLARYARVFASSLHVISQNEVPEHMQIETVISLS